MKKTFSLWALLSFTFLLFGGCEEAETDEYCTLVACSLENGVIFNVVGVVDQVASNGPVTIEVCIEGECRTATVTMDGAEANCEATDLRCDVYGADAYIEFERELPDAITIDISVATVDGTMIWTGTENAAIESTYPNGQACPPTCRSTTATFSPELSAI